MIHFGDKLKIDGLKVYEGYLLDSGILWNGTGWDKVVKRTKLILANSSAFDSFLETCAHVALNQLVEEGLIRYDMDNDEFIITEEPDEEQKAHLLHSKLDLIGLKRQLTNKYLYVIIRLQNKEREQTNGKNNRLKTF